MRHEIKIYEWTCNRCGVVEEVRTVVKDPWDNMFPPRPHRTGELPAGWTEKYDPTPVTGFTVFSAFVEHLCGACTKEAK